VATAAVLAAVCSCGTEVLVGGLASCFCPPCLIFEAMDGRCTKACVSLSSACNFVTGCGPWWIGPQPPLPYSSPAPSTPCACYGVDATQLHHSCAANCTTPSCIWMSRRALHHHHMVARLVTGPAWHLLLQAQTPTHSSLICGCYAAVLIVLPRCMPCLQKRQPVLCTAAIQSACLPSRFAAAGCVSWQS